MQIAEIVARAWAEFSPYAAGKDQRVQTSHLHDIAADSRANAFGKQRQRQSRPFVAGVSCLFDVAVIR